MDLILSRLGTACRSVAMLATLLTACGLSHAAEGRSANMDLAFEAAQWAVLSRAGKALDQMSQRAAGGDADLAEAIRRRQDLHALLLARQAAVEVAARAGTPDAGAQVAALRGEVDSMRGELAVLDRDLRARFPRFAEFAVPSPASIESVQRQLRPRELLLYFFTTADATFVWAIAPRDAAWHRAVLSRDFLAGEIALLRADLDPTAVARGAASLRPETGSGPRVAAFDRMTAYFLYTQLIEPIASMLAGVDTILVAADGPLAGLPLSILVSGRPSGDDRSADALRATSWLGRDHAFVTLPTPGSVVTLRSRPATVDAGPREPFVGFGAPVLGGRLPVDQVAAARGGFFQGQLANVEAVRNLAPLPQTGPELRRLAAASGGSDGSVMLAAAATETAVRERDLSRVDVLAFATHGLLSGDLDGLAEPALVMTPPLVASREDDGLLTASEIAELDLSADWVILSACNTAGSDGRPDAEGLSGLARAFLYAGARAILVSHWPVRDDAAAMLTSSTIETMGSEGGPGRAEALRRAMMSVMNDPDDPTLAHPSAWAPFVIVGDGT
jgi:CHAT domain-containing protein